MTVFDEPLLERRRPRKLGQFQGALRRSPLHRGDVRHRAALVVCDELPDSWTTPFVLDGDAIVARAALLESKVPLP